MPLKNQIEPTDTQGTRASIKEVDETVFCLQTAYEDGRLTEKEFDERISQAIKAKTQQELSHLTLDLGSIKLPATVYETSPKMPAKTTVICSGFEKKGHFIMPKNHSITAVMGGYSLDLTQARFECSVTHIHVRAVMGGVEIYVPNNMHIEVHGTAILGGFDQNIAKVNLPLHAPVLHIHGIAIMGGVDVKTKQD
jgi:hypothetical protein